MHHLKLLFVLILTAFCGFENVSSSSDEDDSNSEESIETWDDPAGGSGIDNPILHEDDGAGGPENCAIFRFRERPGLNFVNIIPGRGERPEKKFPKNYKGDVYNAYCTAPFHPTTKRSRNEKTIRCCRDLWGSGIVGRCMVDESCSKPSYCAIPKTWKGYFTFEKCCQEGSEPDDFNYGLKACYAYEPMSSLTRECDLDDDGFIANCDKEALPNVYPYCKTEAGSGGLANNQATYYCCQKYSRMYSTVCINDLNFATSGAQLCSWNYVHVTSGWIMHSKMVDCCISKGAVLDYASGLPFEQMPKCA